MAERRRQSRELRGRDVGRGIARPARSIAAAARRAHLRVLAPHAEMHGLHRIADRPALCSRSHPRARQYRRWASLAPRLRFVSHPQRGWRAQRRTRLRRRPRRNGSGCPSGIRAARGRPAHRIAPMTAPCFPPRFRRGTQHRRALYPSRSRRGSDPSRGKGTGPRFEGEGG